MQDPVFDQQPFNQNLFESSISPEAGLSNPQHGVQPQYGPMTAVMPTPQSPPVDPGLFDFQQSSRANQPQAPHIELLYPRTGLTRPCTPETMATPGPSNDGFLMQPQPHKQVKLPTLAMVTPQPSPLPVPRATSQSQSLASYRDISILAGERFCFKGVLQNQQVMEDAVRANGGIVTGGGFKHTTYGVVGAGWKVTQSWVKNEVKILDEAGFWTLLERKRREREVEKVA